MQKRRIKTHQEQLRNYETGMAYAGIKMGTEMGKQVFRAPGKEGYRVASGDKLIEATNKVETILKFILEDYSKTINWMIHKSE